MFRTRRLVLCSIGLAFVSLAPHGVVARAGEPASGARVVAGTITVDERGDATARYEVTFPAAEYAAVRAATPDPAPFLRRLRPSRPDYVLGADVRIGI